MKWMKRQKRFNLPKLKALCVSINQLDSQPASFLVLIQPLQYMYKMLTIMCYSAMGWLAKRIFCAIGFLNEVDTFKSSSILSYFWALIANDSIKWRD
jgi:hypothetical protein